MKRYKLSRIVVFVIGVLVSGCGTHQDGSATIRSNTPVNNSTSPDDGWLLASSCTTCPTQLYWTTNQGRSWTKLDLNVPKQYATDGVSLLTAPFPSGTPGVYYADAFTHPIQGPSSLLLFRFNFSSKTGQFVSETPADLGGISLATSQPSNVNFVTEKIGYEIATTYGFSASGLFRTTDGGVTWHQIAANGLPSEQNAQDNLQSIDFISPAIGWVVWTKNVGNTSQDILYETMDGGGHFNEIAVTQWTFA